MDHFGQIKKTPYTKLKAARPSPDELLRIKRLPVSALLENIRSLYNVGAMFRTSDGMLLEKLHLCGYTGYPPRKEIEKTALGSTESVPWEQNNNPLAVASHLQKQGHQLVSLEHTNCSIPYTEAQFNFPLCLIVGNEVEGVSEDLVAISDIAIDIPMRGIKQSLNVSVAFGIVAYHIFNEYQKLTPI